MTETEAKSSSRDRSFRPVIAAVRHNLSVTISVMLLTLVIAATCYMILPRRYTAEASVWLGRTAGAGVPARGGNRSDDPIARETELRVLTSRELATRVVDGLGLQNVRGVGQPRSGPTIVADAAHRQAVGALQDGMKLRAPDRSDPMR